MSNYDFAMSGKAMAVGTSGMALHFFGMAYCDHSQPDGFVHRKVVLSFGVMYDIDDPLAVADRLVEEGVWERVDDGYVIPEQVESTESAAKEEAAREAHRLRQARYRARQRQRDEDYAPRDDSFAEQELGDADELEDADFGADVSGDSVTESVTVTASPSVTQRHSSPPVSHLLPPTPPLILTLPPLTHPEEEQQQPRARAKEDVQTVEASFGPTGDPLVAAFYAGLDKLGAGLLSAGAVEAYNEVIEEIRPLPNALRFVEELMHEAAASTAGRITPRWFQAVVDRCVRERCTPGQRAPRDGVTASSSAQAPPPRMKLVERRIWNEVLGDYETFKVAVREDDEHG